MKKLFNAIKNVIEGLIRNIDGPIGQKVRFFYYKNKLGSCGKNVIIDIGVVITSPSDIFISDNVWIDKYVILLAGKPKGNRKILHKKNLDFFGKEGELHIGNGVHIAPFCVIQAHGGISLGKSLGIAAGSKIYSLSHHYRNLIDKADKTSHIFSPMVEEDKQFLISAPVVIEDNTAIGLNSTILPGTTIPKGTWVGVNTFLNGQNIEQSSIYSSPPGVFIKRK